jgi:hypothetical protein
MEREQHNKLHQHLITIAERLPNAESFSWTQQTHKPDCSCDCRFYLPLDGVLGADWGVCSCEESPRAGLLTFEHQGCDRWESDPEEEVEFDVLLQTEEHKQFSATIRERMKKRQDTPTEPEGGR